MLSEGHLQLVNNEVNQASGTISMKATFANKDNQLWPGLSVTTRLLLRTLKQVTVAPSDAVDRGPDGLYAYVPGPDSKLQLRPITVGPEYNGETVITKGLTPGEKVVTSGDYQLQPGVLVAATEEKPPAAASDTPAPATPASATSASATSAPPAAKTAQAP